MRVLVCRARADAERTAAALADLGHEGLIAPVLRIVAGHAPCPPGRHDAALATSAHAFDRSRAEFDDLLRRPLFAVGDATARAARQAGFRDVRVGRGDARDLATLVGLTLPRPACLLYLCGRDRKPATEAALDAAGYRVATWEAYAAEPEPDWDAAVKQALDTESIDAALHYSKRSATLALAMAARIDLMSAFAALTHLCLSEDASEPLRAAEAPRIRVCAQPDEPSLLALLADTAR